MKELNGVGVALVTPFQEKGMIDFAGLEKLVRHVSTGVHYLVVMGTTGESPTLSVDEQMTVLDFILEINAAKLPVVFGIGGNDTKAVGERMKNFTTKGVSAFLTASPSYNKPTQEGIFRHYKYLSEVSPLPIVLYNVPGRTASNVLPSTVIRIAEETDKIIGIKEAAGSIDQVKELAVGLPKDFILLSGDDPLLVEHMVAGGHGIISVVANAYPNRFRAIYEACAQGHFSEARELHAKMMPLIDDLFTEGNPGGIKETLQYLSICENHMRLPLCPVSAGHSQKLYREIAELGEK
ncbi:4-hydroxy-tetrahydrodipicolinate synthase [Cryomorphaceae bacterium 1068]|nr:4-hydroxy-tetrahydrodipicolinate synthase [Cryomorphaceae bacterium 1068]